MSKNPLMDYFLENSRISTDEDEKVFANLRAQRHLKIKKKIVCKKCGNDKWIFKNGVVLTSLPPIYEDYYECSVCGNLHTVKNESAEQPAPVELYE